MHHQPVVVCLLAAFLAAPAAAQDAAPAPAPAHAAAPAAAPDALPPSAEVKALVAVPAAGPFEPGPGQDVTVVLKDGQVLRGRLVARDALAVTISTAGTIVEVPASGVRELVGAAREATTAGWARDPNRTRYLYGPSAFMLARGEGYASQTELLLSTVAFGVTDHVTIQAGTSVPFLLYDPGSTPFVGAVKVGGRVSRNLHLAGGFQAFVVPGLSSPAVGFLFGTVTVGDEDRHVSLSAGPPFLLSRGSTELGNVLASLSANLRVSRGLALVSENWFVPVDGDVKVIGSAALRLIGEHLGVDVGLIFVQDAGVPAPWLDFTWHWD